MSLKPTASKRVERQAALPPDLAGLSHCDPQLEASIQRLLPSSSGALDSHSTLSSPAHLRPYSYYHHSVSWRPSSSQAQSLPRPLLASHTTLFFSALAVAGWVSRVQRGDKGRLASWWQLPSFFLGPPVSYVTRGGRALYRATGMSRLPVGVMSSPLADW